MHSEEFWRDREQALEGRTEAPDHGFILARIDGRAFHTLTRGYDKPFDPRIVAAMEAGARAAADAIPGCALAYWQSDEISLAFPIRPPRKPSGDPRNGMPFGGRVEKLASVLASATSVGFDRALKDARHVPTFDCRVFVADDEAGLSDYLAWRIADSRKNAISTAAWAEFGHSRLLNVSTAERKRLLEGTRYETIDEGYLYGRVMAKFPSEERVEWTDKRDGTTHVAEVIRNRWVIRPASEENVRMAVARVCNSEV